MQRKRAIKTAGNGRQSAYGGTESSGSSLSGQAKGQYQVYPGLDGRGRGEEDSPEPRARADPWGRVQLAQR